MSYEYKSGTLEHQQAQLIQDLEAKVQTGQIVNRKQYEDYMRKLIAELKEQSRPITQAVEFTSDGIISSKEISEFFRRLGIDIKTAFMEADDTNSVLEKRLQISKTFYNEIQSRISTLRKSIAARRKNLYGFSSQNQQIFTESFMNPSGFVLNGSVIEGKNGELRLQPDTINKVNQSENIHEVNVTFYPDDNPRGGVRTVSLPNRDIINNYSSGSRDMLEKGTWESQMICDSIPDIVYSDKRHRAIIIELDITFESNKRMNYIQFDPFGKYPLEIMSVQYRSKKTDDWSFVTKDDGAIHGMDANIMEFINFDPIEPIQLRFVLLQRNYVKIDKNLSEYCDIMRKLTRDTYYNRYYNKSITNPGSDYKTSFNVVVDSPEANLYEEVLSNVEKAVGHDKTHQILQSTLNPPIDTSIRLYGKKLYKVGAHSIDLQLRSYESQKVGRYYSHNPNDENAGFYIGGSKPTGPARITLDANDYEPRGMSTEYFLVNDQNSSRIPIMPTNKQFYREPCRFISPQYGSQVTIQLTFPIIVLKGDDLSDHLWLYRDGIAVNASPYLINPSNDPSSRQVAFSGYTFDNTGLYSVEYEPETSTSCIVWIIDPSSSPGTVDCTNDSDRAVFNSARLAWNTIATHGAGCKCHPVPAYCRYDEWNIWSLESTGEGIGYCAAHTTRPPIPRALLFEEIL